MNDAKAQVHSSALEAERFDKLLRLLDVDRNLAGEKYEHLRRKLIKFFEWNACFPAEDLVDETFDRVQQRIGDTEIADVVGFAWGVAKNLRQEAWKKTTRTVPISDLPAGERILTDSQNSPERIQEEMQRDRRLKCVLLCLERMPKEDRELFLAYHKEAVDQVAYRSRLAKRAGFTIGSLRVRINRLRNQLERCARSCLASWRISSRRPE